MTIALTSGLPELNQGNLTIDASNAGVVLDGSNIGTTPETLLLDDISLTLDGGPNLIANGDFTAGLGHWRPWDEGPGATRSLNSSDFHSSPSSYASSSVAHIGEANTVYDTTDTSDPFGYWGTSWPFSQDSSVWMPATGGSTAELRFWYKGGLVVARLYALFPDGHEEEIGEWWFNPQAEWTEAVVSQVLPAKAVGVALGFTHTHPQHFTSGLRISSDGNTIRGLQIVNFPCNGIELRGQHNTIGGSQSAGAGPLGQGNLISANGSYGVAPFDIGTSFNVIIGNFIGTNLSGTAAWGNRRDGIFMNEASYNQVINNLISGNHAQGITLYLDSHNNTISENYIGTDASGLNAIGNHISGISISGDASYNVVGPANIIAYNSQNGVEVYSPSSLGNTITQNSIHDNVGRGIDLGDGGNTELAAPVILDFDLGAGIVTGTACANCTVEIFSDSCSEGKVYEGRTTADGVGAFTFNKGVSFPGPHLAATATDADGNTSEFSTDQSFLSRGALLKGERYEAVVPDTLDLQERAKLAINGMTRCTNPEAGYATYLFVDLFRNPPVMFGQDPLYGKFMEGLMLMRMITGSRSNEHVDQCWRDKFLRWLIDDSKPVIHGVEGGRQLAWLADNYRLEKDPCWLELGEEVVDRLSRAMVHKDDYSYLPDDEGEMPTGWEGTYHGWTLQGVTQWYLATGSSTAREVAAELARYLKDHAQVFDSQGHFLACHAWQIGPCVHFHHNGNALVAISEYAAATGDEEFARFARMGYEWARFLGSPLVGFFPEYVTQPDNPRVVNEPCCTADMILLALNLTEAGAGDYWDDVDRYVRNQFAEVQITRSDWIDQMVATLPPSPVEPDKTALDNSTRLVGCFLGWATANDVCRCDIGIQNCCTGNGTRALYYVWEKMVEFKGRTLRIHLLLNRASPWADVDSYIPYEGRVDVRMKQTCNLEIRIPEWAKPEETSCHVDGMPRGLRFQGRYAQVGHVEGGSLVTVTFPISERTVEATIGDVPYTLIIKGNDVVSIDPPGEWYPFYQRAHYRENQVHWVTRERFVLTNYHYVFLPVVLKGRAR
jgi:parallel beta-helix repeat protein